MGLRFSLRSLRMVFSAITIAAVAVSTRAENTAALDADAKQALDKLTASVPAAKALGKDASAVLVFPKVAKVGFVFAAQYGEGVLLRGGKPGVTTAPPAAPTDCRPAPRSTAMHFSS